MSQETDTSESILGSDNVCDDSVAREIVITDAPVSVKADLVALDSTLKEYHNKNIENAKNVVREDEITKSFPTIFKFSETADQDEEINSMNLGDTANKTDLRNIQTQQNSSGHDSRLTHGADVDIVNVEIVQSKLLGDDATGKVLKDSLDFTSHKELAEQH